MILPGRKPILLGRAAGATPASYAYGGNETSILQANNVVPSDLLVTQVGLSAWVKTDDGFAPRVEHFTDSDPFDFFGFESGFDDPEFYLDLIGGADSTFDWAEYVQPMNIDDGNWHHVYLRYDSMQGVADNRVRLYVDGVLQTDDNFSAGTPGSGENSYAFRQTGSYFIGYSNVVCKYAFVQCIQGAAPAPTELAFNDGGTWTHMPYAGSHGAFGYLLDGRNGFLDSINGIDFTSFGVSDITLDFADLPPYV